MIIIVTFCIALFGTVRTDTFTSITSGELVLDVSDYELPWAEAVKSCQSMNKTLLEVESIEKDKTLVKLFVNGGTNVSLPGNNSWIGVAESNEGVWQLESTKQPLYYSRWFVGQPDDINSLNCAYQAVGHLLYWRDANCSAPMFFICESKKTSDSDPPSPNGATSRFHTISWIGVVEVLMGFFIFEKYCSKL